MRETDSHIWMLQESLRGTNFVILVESEALILYLLMYDEINEEINEENWQHMLININFC